MRGKSIENADVTPTDKEWDGVTHTLTTTVIIYRVLCAHYHIITHRGALLAMMGI